MSVVSCLLSVVDKRKIIPKNVGVEKQQHSMSSDKIFDKLAADERRQPQTFSPADLAELKSPSLRD